MTRNKAMTEKRQRAGRLHREALARISDLMDAEAGDGREMDLLTNLVQFYERDVIPPAPSTAAPAGRFKVVPNGPPCPTCGFSIKSSIAPGFTIQPEEPDCKGFHADDCPPSHAPADPRRFVGGLYYTGPLPAEETLTEKAKRLIEKYSDAPAEDDLLRRRLEGLDKAQTITPWSMRQEVRAPAEKPSEPNRYEHHAYIPLDADGRCKVCGLYEGYWMHAKPAPAEPVRPGSVGDLGTVTLYPEPHAEPGERHEFVPCAYPNGACKQYGGPGEDRCHHESDREDRSTCCRQERAHPVHAVEPPATETTRGKA